MLEAFKVEVNFYQSGIDEVSPPHVSQKRIQSCTAKAENKIIRIRRNRFRCTNSALQLGYRSATTIDKLWNLFVCASSKFVHNNEQYTRTQDSRFNMRST